MTALLQRILPFKRAFRLAWHITPRFAFISLIVVVFQSGLTLLSLYLMKKVVDAVTLGMSAPDRVAAWHDVLFWIGAVVAATLVGFILRAASGILAEAQSLLVSDRMQNIIHSKSVEMDLEYYENSQYLDTLHRAQQDPLRPTRIINALLQIAQSLLSLVAIAGLLFYALHWGLIVLLVLSAVPGIIIRLKQSQEQFGWQRSRTLTERRSHYFVWLLTGSLNAKEIRLFRLGDLFRQRWTDLRETLRKERLHFSRRQALGELFTQSISTLAAFAVLVWIAYRTVQGLITIGDLVMFYQAFQRGQGFLQDILRGIATVYENNLFLTNLFEFLDLKPKVVDPPHPVPVPRPIRQAIVFDHVSFRYGHGTRPVLEDVSFTIEPGQMVALVGANGSGKTTLVKLLCRLYDPTHGQITMDGVSLRHFQIHDLRRQFSVLFQDYAQYQVSAEENIWFGNIEQPPDRKRIVRTARSSGADEIIRQLPAGYDTILGNWFEQGEELSVGQWQKIALARAFLRDAQIIVLDEPTSALDPQAEFEIFSRFRELTAGRTSIIISHRLSTVRMADTICLLSEGRIAERGSHDELVAQGGLYARLYSLQAQYYR